MIKYPNGGGGTFHRHVLKTGGTALQTQRPNLHWRTETAPSLWGRGDRFLGTPSCKLSGLGGRSHVTASRPGYSPRFPSSRRCPAGCTGCDSRGGWWPRRGGQNAPPRPSACSPTWHKQTNVLMLSKAHNRHASVILTCPWEPGWLYRPPAGSGPPQRVLKHTHTQKTWGPLTHHRWRLQLHLKGSFVELRLLKTPKHIQINSFWLIFILFV